MPFFQSSESSKFEIDFTKYQPIAVYSYTDVDGKITPIKFKMDLPDATRVTVDIESIRSTKDIYGGVSYSCYAMVNGTRQLFVIVFFSEPMLWCLRKV